MLGTLRGAEHGTNAGTTKRAATKRSGRKELRAMVLKPLVLACTSGLEKKQPVKATVVNWLPNIAKSFQRIRMHPSATSQSVSRFQSLLADQATQNHPQFSGPAWPGLMRQSRRSQSLEVYQLDKFNGSNRVIEKKHAN